MRVSVGDREQGSETGGPGGQKADKTVVGRTWKAALLVLGALALAIVVQLVPRFPAWAIELSLSSLAAALVHLVDRVVLYKDTAEALEKALDDLKGDIRSTVDDLARQSRKLTASSLEDIKRGIETTIATQTESLVAQTKSLAAMTGSGIAQVYPSRKEAAEDLLRDLTNENTTKISIIGISLNDFALGQEELLGNAWAAIRSYVLEGRGLATKQRGLHIRVLIIDPNCLGAALRSGGEFREPPVFPGNLQAHVKMITDLMLDLVEIARKNSHQTGVTFECRLYRTPPMLFLCLVDSVCYVEQYHFWSKRVVGTPIPVLKYRRDDESTRFYPMHTQMERHFSWIWEKASIDLAEFKSQSAVGVDSGMYQSSALNVYTNPDIARERMLFLLEHAERQVAIQGISLHSFFRRGALLAALEKLVASGRVKVRVLFMDPTCYQAKVRSFREALFENQGLTWDEYASDSELHEKSELNVDTNIAIQNLQWMVRDIAAKAGSTWRLNLEASKYKSAPYCFLLRVDDSVLVEQYHYGKIVPEENPAHAILGKDMPVIEFAAHPPDRDLYKEVPRDLWKNILLRRPFNLLENHFDFAWELAQDQTIDLMAPTRHTPAEGQRNLDPRSGGRDDGEEGS